MKRAFLVLMTLVSSMCFAYIDLCPGEFSVTGEYIYFQPTYGVPTFATDTASAETFQNNFLFSSGFRVRGAYEFCRCDRQFEATFLRFKQNHQASATGTEITSTVFNLLSTFDGTVTTDANILYEDGSAVLRHAIFRGCKTDLDLHAGIQSDYIRFRSCYTETVDAGVLDLPSKWDERSALYTIGPQIGAWGKYQIFQGSCPEQWPHTFSFAARANAALLAAQMQASGRFELDAGDQTLAILNFAQETFWRVIPSVQFQFGFEYLTCWYFPFSVNFGYEMHFFSDAILRQSFQRVSETPTYNLLGKHFENFTVQGLYGSLSLKF